MSKRAEEVALKAYPIEITPLNYQDLIEQFGGKTEIDVNSYPRCLFLEGYKQAEKDLAMTWEDIKLLDDISTKYSCEFHPNIQHGSKEYYTEVLRRFHESKEEKK